MSGQTSVKIDQETHRLIGDLAHLLGRSRGAVVRDAVNAFAVWREDLLEQGAADRDERVALAEARHAGRLADGDLATSAAERAERTRIGAARLSPAAFLRLTIHERFHLRRGDLEREFGDLGARNPRLADPRDFGRSSGETVILVDLDDRTDFRAHELEFIALRAIDELVHVEASNAPYPSLAAAIAASERGRDAS